MAYRVSSSASSSFSLLMRRQGDRDVVKTTCSEKKNIDIQVARFDYATSCAFRAVEHPEFKRLMEMLRPGCKLYSRRLSC
ncbi:unnamed protein product [Acanthoscelides obtectus]|uniref:Uncharacterized protein n=1 Tax=Acanthoscelides obtectus TaxID=200917 RepID=A0A9P0KLB2_ACAOB|nr:unnamed protein product [Acanthoscelides obtectus]CAK1646461.1 hypothetical protein AOBTE_LOCUS14646 [Acanthoscelides obtectus]